MIYLFVFSLLIPFFPLLSFSLFLFLFFLFRFSFLSLSLSISLLFGLSPLWPGLELKPEAKFKCNNCGTYQCEVCEKLLHQYINYRNHERTKLKQISNHLICDFNCEDKNLADIYCQDCNLKFCFDCDFMVHSTRKKHTKQPFVEQVGLDLNDYDQNSYQSTNQQGLCLPLLFSQFAWPSMMKLKN